MAPPLKFAVVREDPELECELVRLTGARSVLTVASGGCTALTLAKRFERLAVTAFDVSETQLAHVGAKARAAREIRLDALNVGDDSRDGLNQRGEFEGLFRSLRRFIEEFVCDARDIGRFFSGDADAARLPAEWARSRYWPAAFSVTFHDALLHAMFGPAATQHAEPGSYPRYFQRAFERGLARHDAANNPFLQHVLLGSYRRAPEYVGGDHDARVELVHGSLEDVTDLDRFGVWSLSNVFDWSDDALVSSWASIVRERAPRGAAVLVRQLNNRRDLRRFFEGVLRFDDALGEALLERDRSLFYERIEVGFRV